MARYIALLRGINVGGKNSLPMKTLAAMMGDAGASGVRTYIQSGNVVFDASAAVAKTLAAKVTQRIADDAGLKVPIMLRTAAELEAVTQTNPYLAAAGADTTALHVVFLADKPTPAMAAALDPQRSPPDEFTVLGKEVFVRCPNGVGNSKLTNAWFDSKLKTVSTGRNWRTVMTLLEMARA